MSDVFHSSLELLAEKQAAGHKQLKEELAGMRSKLRQTMDKGLAPADMGAALAMSEAVDAADAAVDKMYAKLFG
jgi:dsDNA-specific endonuclease/ATPase MutS2